MNRRSLLLLAAVLPLAGRAEHAWQPTPGMPPLYLEGEVTKIIWADPHPHLELLHRNRTEFPAEIRNRPLPAVRDGTDLAALLSQAVMPSRGGEIWRVDLPSLARIQVWDMPRPKIGDVIGVVGFAGPPMQGTPTVRAEIVFLARRAFPMRSEPAP